MGEKLDWNRKVLTENDLVARIHGLSGGTMFKILRLSSNHLNSVPVLTGVTQLQQLTELWLERNKITTIQPAHFPQTLQVLLLFNNKLTECPNFTCLPLLTELNLGKNNISTLDQSCIPQNLKILSLKFNKIKELSNITSLHKLEKLELSGNIIRSVDGKNLPRELKILDLSDNQINFIDSIECITGLHTLNLFANQIHIIKALPESLLTVSLLGNPLRELHQGCFSNDRQYQRLMTRNKRVMSPEDVGLSESQIQAMLSPPPSVLKAGYAAVSKYFAKKVVPTDLSMMKDLNLKGNQQQEMQGLSLGCSKGFAHETNLSQCFGDVTLILPELGKAVCSLNWRSTTGTGTGTGFVLGSLQNSLAADNKRYFAILTCYHLMESGLESAMNEANSTKVATFHVYKDASSKPEEITVPILSVVASNRNLDYVMLCLNDNAALSQIFARDNVLGQFIHNRNESPEHLSTLTLIGYPGTEVLKVDFSLVIYNKDHIAKEGILRFPITADDAKMLFYKCSILEGASGSPGFDLGTKTLYIMHQGGTSLHPTGKSIYEHGILLYHVVHDIKSKIISKECTILKIDGFNHLFPTFQPQQQAAMQFE